MKNEIDFPEVRQICAQCQIEIRNLKPFTGSFGKKIFVINQEFLLRVSETEMAAEQEKFGRIAGLDCVPKIIHVGTLAREAGPLHYTLLTLLPGDDFVNAYPETTEAQQQQLGQEIARFMDRLHAFTGTHYDIGLYVAALPRFSGTWREGHQEYWERIRQDFEVLPVKPESRQVFESAHRFLRASAAAMDHQAGPRLLHNDLHPKNMLVHQGKFSGVIDWECSQFGEVDFELCHVIHWCIYPPNPGVDFRPFLRGLFEASPRCARVPDLARRLTIYQIEHEMQQIIWSAGQAESWRVPRLVRWMDGEVEALFRETAA